MSLEPRAGGGSRCRRSSIKRSSRPAVMDMYSKIVLRSGGGLGGRSGIASRAKCSGEVSERDGECLGSRYHGIGADWVVSNVECALEDDVDSSDPGAAEDDIDGECSREIEDRFEASGIGIACPDIGSSASKSSNRCGDGGRSKVGSDCGSEGVLLASRKLKPGSMSGGGQSLRLTLWIWLVVRHREKGEAAEVVREARGEIDPLE